MAPCLQPTHTHIYTQVVIAVLLDEFLTVVSKEKEERKRQEEAAFAESRVDRSIDKQWPLDPLLAGFTAFTTHEDLRTNIAQVYERLDVDEVARCPSTS